MKKLKYLLACVLAVVLLAGTTACFGGEGGGEAKEKFNEVSSEQVSSVYDKFANSFYNKAVFDRYGYNRADNNSNFAYDASYSATFTDLIISSAKGEKVSLKNKAQSAFFYDENQKLTLLYKEEMDISDWEFNLYDSSYKKQVNQKKYAYYKDDCVYNSNDGKTIVSKVSDTRGTYRMRISAQRPGESLVNRLHNIVNYSYVSASQAYDDIKVYLNEDGNAMKFTFTAKAVNMSNIDNYQFIDGDTYVSTYQLGSRKNIYASDIVSNYTVSITLSFYMDGEGNPIKAKYFALDFTQTADDEATASKYKMFSEFTTSEKITFIDGTNVSFPNYVK